MTLAEAYAERGLRFCRPIESDAIYCVECRTGPHFCTSHCSCCEECYKCPCRCGWPPRGRLLTDKEVAFIARQIERAPSNDIWVERTAALLDQIAYLTNPRLPL